MDKRNWVEVYENDAIRGWSWAPKHVLIEAFPIVSPDYERADLIIAECNSDGHVYGQTFVSMRLNAESTEKLIAELLGALISMREHTERSTRE